MNKPTDAEIDAVLCNHWPAFSMQATLVRMWLRDAMRASLDKWGQPAHSGEPVFPFRHGCKWCGKTPVCEHTPQPIQTQPVEREPMTPEQRDALWESCKYDDGEEWTVDWEQIVDAVELHHGIKKGGQHGTDT